MNLRLIIFVFLVSGFTRNALAQQALVEILARDAVTFTPLDAVTIDIYNAENRTLESTTVTDSTGIIFISLSLEKKYFIDAIRKDYVKRILNIKGENRVEGDTLQVSLEMVSLETENKNTKEGLAFSEVSEEMDKPAISKNKLTAENTYALEPNSGSANNGEEFTGYRIVIHFSRFPISKDHILYYSHDEVVEFETKSKNFLYMVEEYTTLQEAEKGHLENYKDEYPLSYVIGFDKGIRIK